MFHPIEVSIDRIETMRLQEEKPCYHRSDYLRDAPRTPQMIDELCRMKMCDWCYQVVDYAVLQREVVAIAMNFLDNFLRSGSARSLETIASRKEYQLAAMTTLFMSIKLFESCKVDTQLLANLSRGCYKEEDFIKMENDILFSLNWCLHCPTAVSFLEHFINLVPDHDDGRNQIKSIVKTYSKYLIERSVEDYELSLQKPSTIALAAISNSLKKISLVPSLCNEKDCSKLVEAIESCTSFRVHGTDIEHVAKRILDLPSKPVDAGPKPQPLDEKNAKECFVEKSSHSPCHSSPVCVSKRR